MSCCCEHFLTTDCLCVAKLLPLRTVSSMFSKYPNISWRAGSSEGRKVPISHPFCLPKRLHLLKVKRGSYQIPASKRLNPLPELEGAIVGP